MAPPPLTPAQEALYGEDRRPALYAGLSVLLVLNNVCAAGRFFTHWRVHYRHDDFSLRRIFAEDCFMLLSVAFVDAVAANLIVSTGYGLGLHSWRINAEDPNYPQNLSNAFERVWIVMVFTGPTFTFIKLTLLFFYRRLFLFTQRWLKIFWWVNVVYVVLWFFGATGFYLFQCWPVQWYFMQYYAKYDVPPPYPIEGQCNATNTTHVAIPLIFGLVSDVAILLLPIFSIWRLRLSRKLKLGLAGVFAIGALACCLDMGRIIELWTDTDDKIDPSYGVVIFLILSAATEVTAVVCACLPVIVPGALKEYKHRQTPSYPYAQKGAERFGGYGGLGGLSNKYDRQNSGVTLSDLRLVSRSHNDGSDGATAVDGDGQSRAKLSADETSAEGTHGGVYAGGYPRPGNKRGGTNEIWIERQIEVNYRDGRLA